MKFRLFTVFAAAGLLLAGCAMEEAPMEGGSIAAVMEDIQTRTAVTDEGIFTWSAGDQVWLEITADPGYVTGTLSSGAGTGSANFAYGSHMGTRTGKAVYPFNSGHDVNGNELTVVLPASYDLGSNLSNTNAAMYGVETDGSIKFNHLAGVMRFKFRNVPVGTDTFILTLDKKINGTFSVDLTEEHPALQTKSTSDESERSITLNFDALTSVQDIMLYVPLPLGTYTTLGLEVKAGSQSVWTYSNTVTNTINRKSLFLMPTVTFAGSVSGDLEGGDNIINLSVAGTANSYIVSKAGSYKFRTVKGNSRESVGVVASAEVLWETFGTSETPSVGSLVSDVRYEDDYMIFSTPESFREGNAVIAAKDENGTILWSWHIWMTDQPQEQVYYNNAGTMMDRNLGATSATPGDVGALGLLYQWGRKDPFLGSSSITSSVTAKSTIVWPSDISSSITNGTLEYAINHPTTYITISNVNSNFDWLYVSDDSYWQSEKTLYDPCPVGWRVPDGGVNGGWNLGIVDFNDDDINHGISVYINSASFAWYPSSGLRSAMLRDVGVFGCYWTVTPIDMLAYCLSFSNDDFLRPMDQGLRVGALSVRCQKEGTGGGPQYDNDFSTSGARSLSDAGTANSYIVSSAGTYSIPAVKGNSSESVGSVAFAEVLWETFGTDERVFKGSLVSGARYENGKIYFKTSDSYREGNAVIAAKDASGTILWSWHIWLTDQPQEQVYYNNAGTMMDRNLGATSATPGDVGALGLLYQWGRKDPFLSSSSISSSIEAKSTIIWPSYVSSNSSTGTISYATKHPTTFIGYNSSNYDWYYTGSSLTDNTRWRSAKTIYDPCPSGWRIPDGGSAGIWSEAFGSLSHFEDDSLYDGTNEGINFSGMFGNSSTIWYPATGYRYDYYGRFGYVGISGYYWSVSPSSFHAGYFHFHTDGHVHLSDYYRRANGQAVRCVRE